MIDPGIHEGKGADCHTGPILEIGDELLKELEIIFIGLPTAWRKRVENAHITKMVVMPGRFFINLIFIKF